MSARLSDRIRLRGPLMPLLAVPLLAGPALLAVHASAAAAPNASSAGQFARPRPSATTQVQQPATCTPQPGFRSPGTAVPWAQQYLNFAAAWPFSGSGRGVTVAVVDSGVSANSPQLSARLTEVSLTGTDPGLDCVGHGTAVAGIVGAAQQPGNPFYGVAPAAKILSVKITDNQNPDCGTLAQGIDVAVNRGAQVINVSTQCPFDAAGLGRLRSAVLFAASRNAVVVAAAGNDTSNGGTPPFYPANYAADAARFPNVLSVGALQQDGTLLNVSDRVTHVSLVAPGAGIVTLAPSGTFVGPTAGSPQNVQGTSYAAPFVAGVAALVRAAHPNLSAAQVVNRIIATADGGTGTGTGAGMVDPVQAVTAVLPGEGQGAHAAPPAAKAVSVPGPPHGDRFGHLLFVSIAAGALGATVLVIAAAVIIPAGRRRGWRPAGPRSAPDPSARPDHDTLAAAVRDNYP